MAQMIPPVLDEAAPPGERELFTALATAAGTEDWIVLHGLRLSAHPTQERGEADFVVVAPGHGVLVIEVKSHKSVGRDASGRWLLGRSSPTTRSPFAQADAEKFAIVSYLSKRMGITTVHVESCVWFTHAPARREFVDSIEWQPWQLLDMADLVDVADRIVHILAAGRRHRAAAGHTWPEIVGPDQATAHRIVSELKPAMQAEVRPADLRRARKEELARLLEDQLLVLDSLAGNDRLLVTGPAGCGKTFLALEAARLESALGRRGLLVCYNHAIGEYLKGEVAGIDGLSVTTLHDLMLTAAGVAPVALDDRSFWEERLPQLAWEALATADQPRYDYLIVDEVQDLCRRNYLDVLDLLLASGLGNGRCLFFGDFDDQVLYDGSEKALLDEVAGPLTVFRQKVNCRNTPGIARVAESLADSQEAYARYRRSDDGAIPRVSVYRDGEHQQQLLLEAVQSLRDDGFDLHEIVVLSRYRDASAAATTTDPWLRQTLLDVRRGGAVRKGRIRYSTIHSFKGLEASAVIITDVTESTRGPYFDLLNVGVTRARDRLVMLGTRAGFDQHGLTSA
ncbi:MAG: NERD domain-containing protein [Actinobacteria bacterium]|nr:NERD domain-containing protein [Actinomycetota bacterium]